MITYYYINIFWKYEWSPIYITTDYDEANKLLEQARVNWTTYNNSTEEDDAPNIYDINPDTDIKLDSRTTDSSLIYDCDWFNE